MVKASNLLKKLLPIGLVIGGLYFLSQSKKVNIFRTSEPSLTVTPAEAIPIMFEKTTLVPIFQQEELTPESAKTLLEQEYGTLYTKERVRADYQYHASPHKSYWIKDWKDDFRVL